MGAPPVHFEGNRTRAEEFINEVTDHLISSASGMERGEVFYGPTDWLRSCNLMTHYNYDPDSSSGLDD
jgi:hypothetical protein